MKVLRFIAVLAVAIAAAVPSLAMAQQGPPKVPRIAYFMNRNAPTSLAQFQGLSQGLADLGYIDAAHVDAFARQLNSWTQTQDKNVAVEFFLFSSSDDIAEVAAKAAASKPDVIMTVGTPATQALKDTTSSIPILTYTDLLGSGFVASLAHPGGNITGISTVAPDLAAKKIEILQETVPSIQRIALLNVPDNAAISREVSDAASAAKALGIEPVVIDFSQEQELAPQFDRVASARVQAVYVPISTYFTTKSTELCDLLTNNEFASVSSAAANCSLVSYGADPTATYRRFASYVDALVKGVKPSDLPVEEPTVLDLAVNIATAQKIGLTIPSSILLQATQVIQ